jgi:hypothetical protein
MGATRVRASRTKDGRARAAAGISLGVHLAIGALAGNLLQGPSTLLADVGTGDPVAIDVGIEEPSFDVPAPAVEKVEAAKDRKDSALATAAAPQRTRAPKPRTAIHVSPRPAAAPPITTAGTTPMVAADADQDEPAMPPAPTESSSASIPQVVAQSTTSALLAAAPATVRAGSAAATAARPARSTPVFLTAEVASYLRSQDDFPALPASMRHRGARYKAQMEICVAPDGHVSDVGFRSDPTPALDSVLQAAVRGWRYRPFLVDGVPTPFCHRINVSYEMG